MSTPNNTQLGNKSVQETAETPVIPPLQHGAMTETLTRITITPSDMLMFAAVAMLPFDGTKIGIPLPIGRQSPLGCSPCTQSSTGDTCAIPHAASCRSSSFPCYWCSHPYTAGSHMEYTPAQPQSHSSPYF